MVESPYTYYKSVTLIIVNFMIDPRIVQAPLLFKLSTKIFMNLALVVWDNSVCDNQHV
jgi:hypothetical protein